MRVRASPRTSARRSSGVSTSARPDGEAFGNHSGLGLSISRRIVEAHGGTIQAENRYDGQGRVRGARFVVELPLSRAGGQPDPHTS